MFRWLRERRQRKQKEAAERRAQLRRKAQLSGINLTSSQLRSYRAPEVIPFHMTLAPDQPDPMAAVIAVESVQSEAPRPFAASPDYAPVKSSEELPRRIDVWAGGGSGGAGSESSERSGGGSGRHHGTQHHYGNGDNVGGNRHVTQHHFGSGDNIGGSVHHASSHSSHDYGSSSSYDSGSSSGGGDSSW